MKKTVTKKSSKKGIKEVCFTAYQLDQMKIASAVKEVKEVKEIVENAMPEKSAVEKQIELLFSILDNQQFAMPFFSEALYEVLILQGKVKNIASVQRLSGDESFPYIFPYDEKYQEKGFSGSRGRCFLACCIGLSADQLITFDLYNRKLEGTQERKKNIHRKILAISKAYFPKLHDSRKVLYPISKFK
jgi:hypothetical protein